MQLSLILNIWSKVFSHKGSATEAASAEKAIRDIRRTTRRRYSAEEKIRTVLEGLLGESSIAELCRSHCAWVVERYLD